MGNLILFLDVDGVLNHADCWRQKMGPTPVDPACVARLARVLDATDARVVLSSSWRGVTSLERKLRDKGALRKRYPRDWRTKRLDRKSEGGVWIATSRGTEIAEWLSRHPEVSGYAIIDDEGDMLPDQLPRFVQTSFEHGGMLDSHADRLIAALSQISEGKP